MQYLLIPHIIANRFYNSIYHGIPTAIDSGYEYIIIGSYRVIPFHFIFIIIKIYRTSTPLWALQAIVVPKIERNILYM